MTSSGSPDSQAIERRLQPVLVFIGRAALVVWLVAWAAFALKGWRERTAGQVPQVPIGDLSRQVGQRVWVRGVMLGPWFQLPNGHLVALQAAHVSSSRRRGARPSYDNVWPPELWVGDGPARVRVETQGLATQYVRQVAVGYTTGTVIGGDAAGWLLPQLNRGTPNARVRVHVIWRSEEVHVLGVVSLKDDQPVIRSGGMTAPLVVTTIPLGVLSQASRFEGSWKLAAGSALFLFGTTIWLWLRAGFGQTIRGVKIYPLFAAASREGRTRAEIEERIDRRLTEVGVDVGEYRRQRRAYNRRAVVGVLACPVLAVVLGVWLGGKPVSVLQTAATSPLTLRRPTPPPSTAASRTPAPRMLTFTSDSAKALPAARKIFVPFTLQRPSHWWVARPSGDAASTFYCGFARRNAKGLIVESIEVSGYDSETLTGVDQQSLPALAGQAERQRKGNFLALPTDRKLYEKPGAFGGMPAYEVAFEHVIRSDAAGTYTVFWKMMLIPAANGPHRGLVVSFGGNTLAPEITRLDDLGTMGELAPILQSFRVLR